MLVRGVGNKIVKTDQYTHVHIYFFGTINGVKAQGSILLEAHLVNDLRANVLIGNDTLKPQGAVIDLGNEHVTFGACRSLIAPITIRTRTLLNAKRTIKSKGNVIIPPMGTVKILVGYSGSIPADRDFLFEPECSQDLGLMGGIFTYIIDDMIQFVEAYNATAIAVRIPRKARLGLVIEFEQDGAYLVSPDLAPLVAGNSVTWKGKLVKGLMAVAAMASSCANTAVSPYTPLATSVSTTTLVSLTPTSINPALEHILPNSIMIYGNDNEAK